MAVSHFQTRGIITRIMGLLPASAPLASSRLLAFGVTWESPWQEFRTSLRAFFTGPRAPQAGEFSGGPYLTIYWVRGKLPARAFMASSLWHVAAVLVMLLPIWKLLPSTPPTLAPVRIELTWYGPTQDLPPIELHGPSAKPSPAAEPRKPAIQRGADAYHPRQTILSTPVHITHPRQTLIQPKSPPTPPKILPQLPNIVEWAATAPQLKRPHFSQTISAPRVQRRAVSNVAAPEVANAEKNLGPLNIASAPAALPLPRMPLPAMSTPTVAQRAPTENAAAPEIGSAASGGDASLHRLIALSADPAPPAPEVSVPEGNLSARLSISPDGKQPGAPSASGRDAAGGTDINAVSTGGASGSGSGNGGGNGALPPGGISISGGNGGNPRGSGGGIAPGGTRPGGKLNLKPAPLSGAHPDLSAPSHTSEPRDISKMANLAPEKILWDKQVYTLHVDMPNMTSISGSWVLNFAQLDDDTPRYIKKPDLSGPVPVRKVDPKYPQALIEGHVEGQVILYAIIRKDGSVDSIQLVHGLDPELNANSMEALARWQFRPGTREGVPVELEAVVYIPFHFRDLD